MEALLSNLGKIVKWVECLCFNINVLSWKCGPATACSDTVGKCLCLSESLSVSVRQIGIIITIPDLRVVIWLKPLINIIIIVIIMMMMISFFAKHSTKYLVCIFSLNVHNVHFETVCVCVCVCIYIYIPMENQDSER